jgi:hypothetical protein
MKIHTCGGPPGFPQWLLMIPSVTHGGTCYPKRRCSVMTGELGDDFPVLDVGALQDLQDDAGEAVAQAFMEDYLLMLLARALRIFRSRRDAGP